MAAPQDCARCEPLRSLHTWCKVYKGFDQAAQRRIRVPGNVPGNACFALNKIPSKPRRSNFFEVSAKEASPRQFLLFLSLSLFLTLFPFPCQGMWFCVSLWCYPQDGKPGRGFFFSFYILVLVHRRWCSPLPMLAFSASTQHTKASQVQRLQIKGISNIV